ncbi:MAG: amidohydrolase family protein [Spirochaetaceae bacterium]|jgi:dihydroorotase|nr:amidohydrolase family protein [Spirochaetaceae bacterium]
MIHRYLVKNANVMSVFDGSLKKTDILVEDGIVTKTAPGITASVEEIIDAEGLTVTPGWVDIHAHIYYDGIGLGIDPQMYLLPKGVTYAVDPGTSGADNFADFRRYVRWCTDLKYKSYLNIAKIGVPIMGYELTDMGNLDKDACKRVFRDFAGELLGLKVRVTSNMCKDPKAALSAVRELCDELHTTFCVHATRCSLSTEEILGFMKKGDVFTHSYAKTDSGILDKDGSIKAGVREARERGVIFDMGHGINSFAFDVAKKAIDQGFELDAISTDLHVSDVDGPVYDMPTTISKFLCLGVSLEKAIQLATSNPVKLLALSDKLLEIKPGEKADFTAFLVERGDFRYTDCDKCELSGNMRLVSKFTCVGRKIFTPRKVTGKNRPIGIAAIEAANKPPTVETTPPRTNKVIA